MGYLNANNFFMGPHRPTFLCHLSGTGFYGIDFTCAITAIVSDFDRYDL